MRYCTSDLKCLGSCGRGRDAEVVRIREAGERSCSMGSFSFSISSVTWYAFSLTLAMSNYFFTSICCNSIFLRASSDSILVVSALSCASILANSCLRFASSWGTLSLASFAASSAITSAFLRLISEDTLEDLVTLEWPEIMDLLWTGLLSLHDVRLPSSDCFSWCSRVLVNASHASIFWRISCPWRPNLP